MNRPAVRLLRNGEYGCPACSQSFRQKGKVSHHYDRFHVGRPSRLGLPPGSATPVASGWAAVHGDLQGSRPVSSPFSASGGNDTWDEDVLVVPPGAFHHEGANTTRAGRSGRLSRQVVVVPISVRIAAYYRSKGDIERTKPLVSLDQRQAPLLFSNDTLRKMRRIALGCGGSGMSKTWRERLWEATVSTERETAKRCGKGGMLGPMESAFPSAARWVQCLKDEQNRCLSVLAWRKTDIPIGGKTFIFYSRNAMDVLVDALESASDVQLHSNVRTRGDGGPVTRTGILNSDLYQNAEREVRCLHRYKGKVFTVAAQLFSDSSLVSHNGGTCGDAL